MKVGDFTYSWLTEFKKFKIALQLNSGTMSNQNRTLQMRLREVYSLKSCYILVGSRDLHFFGRLKTSGQ